MKCNMSMNWDLGSEIINPQTKCECWGAMLLG